MSTTVRDVMTTSVIAVRGDTPFKEMAAMLGSSRVSGFPVIDQAGKVIGVVSETDMLIKEADRASHPELFAGLRRSRDLQKAAGATAAGADDEPPCHYRPGRTGCRTPLSSCTTARLSRLPVVDEAGHLVGIVSQVECSASSADPTRRSAAK